MLRALCLTLVAFALPVLAFETHTANEPEIRQSQTFIVSSFVPYEPNSHQTLKTAPGRTKGLSLAIHCSCVLYARFLTGFDQNIGKASNWPTNSKYPVLGGIVITNEGPVGHVARIIDIRYGKLLLDESNYKPCQITNTRELPIDSPLIKGYWVTPPSPSTNQSRTT